LNAFLSQLTLEQFVNKFTNSSRLGAPCSATGK